MKKKSFLFFCLIFVFGIFLFNFRGVDLAWAESASEHEFQITYSAETGLSVSGQTEATWQEALSYIKEQTTDGEIAKLNFSGVSGLTESLELSGADFILTGSITSSAADPVIKLSSENTFTLSNLSVTGDGENAIEVSGENPAIVNISNLTVGGTKSAMEFATTGHTVNFSGTVTCNTLDRFARFKDGLSFNVKSSMEGSSLLKLEVPFDAYHMTLVSFDEHSYYSESLFSAVSKNDEIYSVESWVIGNSPTTLLAQSKLLLSYDTRDGNITAEDYTQDFLYKTEININFLSWENVNKDYHEFAGWFAKYTLSEDEKLALDGKLDPGINELYFDTISLKEYIEAGENPADMLDYFSTDVDEIKNTSGRFASYIYNPEDTACPFKFLVEHNQKIVLTARWVKKLYTLNFNSVGGSNVDSMTKGYGETISEPEQPQREGYTFAGWFEDQTYEHEFHFETMPPENKTLYAKWDIESYHLTLHLNGATYLGFQDIYETDLEYGSVLGLPTLTREGYNFLGWFESDSYETLFEQNTMPANALTLYANFEIMTFEVYFIGTNLPSIQAKYGDSIERPENPQGQTGYIFYNWYEDSDHTTLFDFDNYVVKSNTYIYADWRQAEYQYRLVLGNGENETPPQNVTPGTRLTEPAIPQRHNYRFIGWFKDSAFTDPFDYQVDTMPYNNLTVYAGWQAKRVIVLDLQTQEYSYNQREAYYKNFSDMDGFAVWYLVSGTWTTDTPTNAGTYDVRIVRSEDDTYASFEIILNGGFVINYAEKDLSLLIAGIFILFAMEIFAIIVLKVMKKRKVSKVYALFPIMLGENTILPNTQFVLLIIACALVLLGFIYLIYTIVDVHHTAKNEAYLPSNLDNRERFKDELEFQLKNQGDADFETKTKTDESFGEKYSARDIEKLLKKDTFKADTLAKRKFNVEDNSSTNWNEVSTNKGSDILARSKDINEIASGNLNNRAPVKFFDEDESTEPPKSDTKIDDNN